MHQIHFSMWFRSTKLVSLFLLFVAECPTAKKIVNIIFFNSSPFNSTLESNQSQRNESRSVASLSKSGEGGGWQSENRVGGESKSSYGWAKDANSFRNEFLEPSLQSEVERALSLLPLTGLLPSDAPAPKSSDVLFTWSFFGTAYFIKIML